VTALDIPSDALVILIGAAGSGKSSLAKRHFPAEAILSSDAYREAISGDASDQSATDEAFERLEADLHQRLGAGGLTVVDATNVQTWARRQLLRVARVHGRPTIAIVLAIPVQVSLDRNSVRPGRRVPPGVVRRQDRDLRRSLARLGEEGHASVLVLSDPDEVDAVSIRTQRNVPKERHPTL
jgi:predicted kinase